LNAIIVRRLQPSDSIESLTEMLHRAFAGMAQRGLNCTCVDQTVETTRRRIALGDCFVALIGGRIVGTVTVHETEPGSAVGWYRKPTVASLHQLAVDPTHQQAGVGRALLRAAEAWTLHRRYRALALDTPEPATELQAYYLSRGYRPLETVQFAGKHYRSSILSKLLAPVARIMSADGWPPRHPAEAPHLCGVLMHRARSSMHS